MRIVLADLDLQGDSVIYPTNLPKHVRLHYLVKKKKILLKNEFFINFAGDCRRLVGL